MDKYLALLEAMVNVDSGSGDQEGFKKLAAIIRPIAEELRCSFESRVAHDGSVHYVMGRGEGERILMIAHLDTVFPQGTAARRPFTVAGERAYGPGVSDCKSGVVTILAALDELNRSHWPACRIECLFNTDEEMSSPGSREIIADLAKGARAVLVVEPAEGNNLTVARKGIGRFVLKVSGKAAHSGSNYVEGRNAVVEMAHKIIAIQQLSDLKTGMTFNPAVVKGGSKPNIIPDYAEVEIDLRLKTAAQERQALECLNEVVQRRWIAGTKSWLEGMITRPPMEPTPANLQLYQEFKLIADDLGIALGRMESGGGSDANLAAACGVPVIDGLGPVGGGHHTEDEYLEISSLFLRIKLLTEYLSRCQNQ